MTTHIYVGYSQQAKLFYVTEAEFEALSAVPNLAHGTNYLFASFHRCSLYTGSCALCQAGVPPRSKVGMNIAAGAFIQAAISEQENPEKVVDVILPPNSAGAVPELGFSAMLLIAEHDGRAPKPFVEGWAPLTTDPFTESVQPALLPF